MINFIGSKLKNRIRFLFKETLIFAIILMILSVLSFINNDNSSKVYYGMSAPKGNFIFINSKIAMSSFMWDNNEKNKDYNKEYINSLKKKNE